MAQIVPPHRRGHWVPVYKGDIKEEEVFVEINNCKCKIGRDHYEPRPKVIDGLTGRVFPTQEGTPYENQ